MRFKFSIFLITLLPLAGLLLIGLRIASEYFRGNNSNNTAIGVRATVFPGFPNSFQGYITIGQNSALASNTAGYGNTAFGYQVNAVNFRRKPQETDDQLIARAAKLGIRAVYRENHKIYIVAVGHDCTGHGIETSGNCFWGPF